MREHKIRNAGLIVLGCLVFLSVLGGLGVKALMVTDKYYVCLREWMMGFLGKENHFDGGSWFAAEATLIGAVISAVPGMFCGILALVQTQRLHALEARYRRPMMELNMAKLLIVQMENVRDILLNAPLDKRQLHCVREAEERRYKWYIDLQFSFFLKSEIAVKKMSIKSIKLCLNKVDYEFEFSKDKEKLEENKDITWHYKRDRQGGQLLHTLSWSLCPYEKLHPEEEFYEKFKEFACYNQMGNLDFSDMYAKIYINVWYEFGGEQKIESLLEVGFNVDQIERKEYVANVESANGFFTYDVRR